MIAKVDGQVVEIAANEYYRWRLSALLDAVSEHVDDDDQIVELGCGFGYNLFALALAGFAITSP